MGKMSFQLGFRSIATYFIRVLLAWVIALFFLLIFQVDDTSILSIYRFQNIVNVLCFGSIAGLMWACIFKFATSFLYRIPNYLISLLVRVLVNVSTAYLLVYIMYRMGGIATIDNFPSTFSQLILLYHSRLFYAVLAYFFIVGSLMEVFYEIDRKLGPGLLFKFLLGEYYKPKEEHRIFLFMDLKSSTYYAEKLGHFKYSRLIQDCFKDVSNAVRHNRAEIYQYVGDEIVLSWKMEKGLKDARCLRVFYDFLDLLDKRKEYYQKEYGMVPIFKAGVHAGKIMVAEVGELKSEISYHGDTVNTASRIQGLCNSYGSRLLLSGSLFSELSQKNIIDKESTYLGEVLLTGKKIPTEIYSLSVN